MILLILACNDPGTTTATAQAGPAAATTASPVATSWLATEEITGSLEPASSVQVGFDMGGRMISLDVKRGQAVTKGQVLARLDSRIAAAQVAQAEAAVTAARAQLAAGEAGWEKAQALYKAGGMSDQQYKDAEAGILAGRAGVQQAEAALRMARTSLDMASLEAPISGVVTNGPDNAGMVVGPGTPLFVIEDLSALQLKGTANEGSTWLQAELEATVPGAGAAGKVVRVIPSLDPATRRIPVEILIDQPGTLMAHAFARATVTAGAPQPAWTVPAGAVVARPDFCVFVQADPEPRRVPVVVVGSTSGDTRTVLAELSQSDQLLVNPPSRLGTE